MSRARKGARWDAWPRMRGPNEPFQLGQVGFSRKEGELGADLFPVQGTRGTLTMWRGELFRLGDRSEILAVVEEIELAEARDLMDELFEERR